MRYPQIVIYERDGRLAELLRRLASGRRWKIREPRRMEPCLRLLHGPGPSVFVLRIGTDVLREMTLLDEASWLCPEVATIVVSDGNQPALDCLAWELGASYVHSSLASRGALPELVGHVMDSLYSGNRQQTMERHDVKTGGKRNAP
jgi:hypothetical protein